MSDRGNCPDCIEQIEAQAAEIERLGSVIDATARHWLALHDKHPIQWEGAIDGAMAAACAEIERLREAGAKLAGYAGHDAQCEDVTGAYPGSCSCGYTEAWQTWSAALGETE